MRFSVLILGTVLLVAGCATTAQKQAATRLSSPVIAAARRVQSSAASADSQAARLAQALHSPAARTQPGKVYIPLADSVHRDTSNTLALARNSVRLDGQLPAKIIKTEEANVAAGQSQVKNGIFYRTGRTVWLWIAAIFLLAILVAACEIWGSRIPATGVVLLWLGRSMRAVAWLAGLLFGWIDGIFLYVWKLIQGAFVRTGTHS